MPTTLTRSLLVVLLPGVVAVSPWLLALALHTEATLGLEEYPALGHALLFACVAVVGSIFEDLGTYIEVYWDRKRETEYSVKENWYAYLAHEFEAEPVGFKYMARLATTLYFELSMAFAAPTFMAGAGVLAASRFPEILCWIIPVTAVLVAAAVCFFIAQASATHRVLCETRRQLNQRLAA